MGFDRLLDAIPGLRLTQVRLAALRHLAPPPRLRLSEWAEANLRLAAGSAAVAGPLRLYPFQRDILDSMGDPLVPRVTMLKSTRVGYTMMLTAVVANYVANDPSAVLVLQPTESDARGFTVSDLEPLFEASPILRGALRDAPDDTGRSTLLHRLFPGGSLKVVAARAPRNLRRHTARVLLADEVDGMEVTAEGPPLLLAEKRTQSFDDRKIIVGSTPAEESTSAVLRAYGHSDQRVFEPRCPECGEHHEVRWADIRWPPDRPDDAAWCCPGCGSVVPETAKAGMVAAGRWRATRPEVIGHHGYKVNALVSPLRNASWATLACEFLAAKGDSDSLRVFVNTSLAEGWRDEAESLDEGALRERAEPFGLDAIPTEVRFLTVGADVQHDRIEASFIGWTVDNAALVLAHHVLWGDVMRDDVWREFDDLLRSDFRHPLGGVLRVDACAVDSGDGQTMDRVLAFAAPRFGRRVVAIKGASGFSRAPIMASVSRVKGARLFIVGVDGLKARVFRLLAQPGAIRFSRALPPEYFEQVASERIVTRFSRGQPTRQFDRIGGRRAEALDCLTYATAVRDLVQADPARREAGLGSLAAHSREMPAVLHSRWLAGDG